MITPLPLSYDLVHRAGTRHAAVAVEIERDGVPARFARVQAVGPSAGSSDPAVVEVRADADGRALFGDLASGRWSLVARDSRRTACSAATTIDVPDTGVVGASLHLDAAATGALVVDVRGADALPAETQLITVVEASGHQVTAPVSRGLALVRGLRPGLHTVVVPAAFGHLGTTLDNVEITSDRLLTCTAVVPAGGVVSGRVVQGGAVQYAAVVTLLDADGNELESTRTDPDGRFALGTGLRSSRGLTVEATSGPQSLHVTRTAVADVVVLAGTHRDLGDVHLPATGPGAVWASRTRAVAGMKLPSTRV